MSTAAAELKPLVKSLNSASTDEVCNGSPYGLPFHFRSLTILTCLTAYRRLSPY